MFGGVHGALPMEGAKEAGALALVEGSWPVGYSRFWTETQGTSPTWGCQNSGAEGEAAFCPCGWLFNSRGVTALPQERTLRKSPVHRQLSEKEEAVRHGEA